MAVTSAFVNGSSNASEAALLPPKFAEIAVRFTPPCVMLSSPL